MDGWNNLKFQTFIEVLSKSITKIHELAKVALVYEGGPDGEEQDLSLSFSPSRFCERFQEFFIACQPKAEVF